MAGQIQLHILQRGREIHHTPYTCGPEKLATPASNNNRTDQTMAKELGDPGAKVQ